MHKDVDPNDPTNLWWAAKLRVCDFYLVAGSLAKHNIFQSPSFFEKTDSLIFHK